MARSSPEDALACCETEQQWYETLPALLEDHGQEKVEAAMATLLGRSQIKECFKRLEARKQNLVWIDCAQSAGALVEVGILVTDRSLNEMDRCSWLLDRVTSATQPQALDAAAEIVSFLAAHCTKGHCSWAGVRLDEQHALLRRTLPAVLGFVDPRAAAVDLVNGGVPQYASLLDLGVLPDGSTSAFARTVRDFEVKLRAGHSPTQHGVALPPAALDRLESYVCTLGWARTQYIMPPKAARYVTAALGLLAAMIVLSTLNLGRTWLTMEPLQ